jgi:hypothetical protein
VAGLLSIADLPGDFEYPPEFVRVVELGLTQLEPGWIIDGDHLRTRYRGLRKRYPSRMLVPFAIRQDCDDVACFELNRPGVVIIHDFASPGWEQRDHLPDFYSWLRRAIDDLTEFDV